MLNPHWKDFSCLQRLLYHKHAETLNVLNRLQAFEYKTLAHLHLKEKFNILLENTAALSPLNIPDEEKKKEYDIFDIMITNHTIASSSTSDSELFMYEYERDINRNENPFRWWNDNKKKYPLLSQLACKYLYITGTSVPSEKMFLAPDYLTSDKRSR